MSEDSPKNERTPTSRKRSLAFLVQFLILVAILLIGYRYAINSSANIRYLYTIASQTSSILNILGHDSNLEPNRTQLKRAKVRTEFNEWDIHYQIPLADNEETTPPTPWEYWLLSAYRKIQEGPGLLEHGPTIRFTARQGLLNKRTEATKRLASDPERTDTSVTEVLNLQTKVKSLDEEIANLSSTPNANKKLSDRAFSFRIVPDCGAIPSLSIYLAAVLAFPVPWRKRIIGAIAGLTTLYAINIARLVILAFVGAYDSSPNQKIFTFIHEYVWQSIFLLFVVCVWLAWIELIVKTKAKDTA
jgi:exosortase/archaeosortase family protein